MDPCEICGHEERNTYTMSVLKVCAQCDREHCTTCRHDYDAWCDDGENWQDRAVCVDCGGKNGN